MQITINDTAIDVWAERDRTFIGLRWASGEFNDGEVIAEWWDADALQMFHDGFFSDKGMILGTLINPRPLHESVFEYCQTMGLIGEAPFVKCSECSDKYTRKRLPKDRDTFVCIYCVEQWRKDNPEFKTKAEWRSWERSAKTYQEA